MNLANFVEKHEDQCQVLIC